MYNLSFLFCLHLCPEEQSFGELTFILILCLKKHFAGHYTIMNGTSFNILKEDLISAYQANNYLPVWTFNTSRDNRIRLTFHEFGFYWNNYNYDLLDIGDGLIYSETSTRLATFGGRDLPSNVTSVSNAAWVKVNEPYIFHCLAHVNNTFQRF